MKHLCFVRGFFVIFFVPFLFLFNNQSVFASTWVTDVMFDNNFSVTVQPQQSINATINTSTWIDNSNSSDNANWYSTKYTISSQDPVCVDTTNFISSDFHQNSFNFLAPSAEGTYNITFQAFAAENCIGGAITKSITLSNVITVKDSTSPIITVKPESIGDTNTNTFSNVSFKLFDAQKIDKISINGVFKDIVKDKEIIIDYLKPGNFGAIEGQNVLVVYDVSENASTFNFTLDTTAPIITISPYNTNQTNQDITVTASTNEGLLNISFHIFTQNGSFEFIATDLAGNITRKTITITNINKNNSSDTNDTNDTSDTSSQTTTTNPSTSFTSLVTNRFSLPAQTYNLQISEINIDENISTNSGQILGSVDTHNGCWLPILSIIALVVNFFFIKYSHKFINIIPFVISLLSFSVDWLMLKKYGCDITWLTNYFWIGEVFSWLIPISLKNKISQK